ncbi:cytochrome b5 [Pluteus cervinus]|uniref:Cytochrome b5 n=1 Tax=Pluteus cervinus TaxID=181527 RepID=A0ACD3B9E0_9AGAR|nr:cytochrome b5 [Pluteus cervinus]
MSWIGDLSGGETRNEPFRDTSDTPKVPDPHIKGRMVSDKAANRPFLAYKEYRAKREAEHEAWLERKKEREAKIARGEKVGPEERDPTAEPEVGILGLLKFVVYLLLFITLAGKFFTGSYVWESDSKWLRLKTYMPTGGRLFSEGLLAEYDGTTPDKPIYLAIDGDVYDVSKGKAYQQGGSYAVLTGIDAARAFGTGCFKDHRTHDLRGLAESELNGVQHWKKFYAEHKDYFRVGRVQHPPIDPLSPIPVHCDPKKAAKQAEAQRAKDKATPSPDNKGGGKDHNEL